MGCIHSSSHRMAILYIFNSNDVFYLKQSWNIIKTHDLQKFAQDVILRTMNQSPTLRVFWRSKIQVEGNNYDYSQSESCLRTDLSWQIGLRDYIIQFSSIFDQLISVINDENRFQTYIRSLEMVENIFPIEYESLSILKKCIMEIFRERFKIFNYDFTDDYERVWNKFLTFFIDYIIKQKNTRGTLTEIITASTTTNEQPSRNVVN